MYKLCMNVNFKCLNMRYLANDLTFCTDWVKSNPNKDDDSIYYFLNANDKKKPFQIRKNLNIWKQFATCHISDCDKQTSQVGDVDDKG